MTDYKALYEQQLQENKKLKEENKYWKELYKAQERETDIEHQRYLETAEKYSERLWEVCQELDIENDDTSQNIIDAINKLKEDLQKKIKKVETSSKLRQSKINKLQEYQKDIDSTEWNLLEILQEADVKDKFGDTYEELTYQMVPDIVKVLVQQIKELQQTNNEQREELKYSTLLTGETIQSVFQDEYPILADSDKFCNTVAEKYREGVANYLYENMEEMIENDIDMKEEICDCDSWFILDINHPEHPCRQEPELMKEYEDMKKEKEESQ